MKQRLLWLVLTVAATGCKDKQEEVKPVMRELTAAVYASGTLVPEQEYKVVSSVDGYLVKAWVKEGDTVSNGQMLFEIGNEIRQAQEQGARAVVQRTVPVVAENAPQIKELEGRLEVAGIKKQQDSLQYIRYKSLYDQKAISQSSYERYYLAYQSSSKDHRNLEQQLRQLRLANNLQLQQAENQLSVVAAQSGVGRLKSYVNGVVYDVYKKEGDLVVPNQPVALIGAGKMIAKLLVDEDDLEKVFAGQKVLITMDAYPDKIFKARITKVYPLLSKVEQSFRVDAEMEDVVPQSIYGLNLEANIVVAENKKVLVIPRKALLKGDRVLVKTNGEEKAVKIETGIEDDEYVEVRNGLDASSTIIIKK